MLLEVWVERETGFLRQVRTRTDQGVATTYTFVRLEPNARLSAEAFEFEPPRGVEVFDS
jgi:outer membrane lipoprotein-sorting protein